MKLKEHFSSNNSEEIQIFKHKIAYIFALLLSAVCLFFFLIHTKFIDNELFLIILAFGMIYPFRKNIDRKNVGIECSKIIKSYSIGLALVFGFWILVGLGTSLIPFILALVIGYLLEPFVVKLEKLGLARWISSLILILITGGLLFTFAIFFFPILFEQSQTITIQISTYIANLKEFGQSEDMFSFLNKFGIDKDLTIKTLQTEFLPRIEKIASKLFDIILQLVLSFSQIGTQIVNLIVLPFLIFYFLKDFSNMKLKFEEILGSGSENFLKQFNRFDNVLRTYISWQVLASLIVATSGSIVYSIFSVPYGILIACISGLLNPIPYFGSIFSILIGGFIALLVNDGNFIQYFLIILINICAIHFVCAYLLEPNIAGKKVGLHPILMIFSVFVFNSVFGIIGMLVAVPITSVIVMFLKDVYAEHKKKQLEAKQNEMDLEKNEVLF
jgi:predicted PurR-regulated permease PerM